MPRAANPISVIATRDLLERYVDADFIARRRFLPGMEDFYIARLEDFRASVRLPTATLARVFRPQGGRLVRMEPAVS